MRTSPLVLAMAFVLCVVRSEIGVADTITNYQLSGVTFTSGSDTWDMTGGFTYDDFNNGGGGTESNVLFTITKGTGPSTAFTGTYTQTSPVSISGNGFFALGTRTDGSPAGSPYDVALGLLSPSQLGDPHVSPVILITFTVPGFGNFAGSENVTGEVIPSSATPLPAALPLFAGGLVFVGYLTHRRKKKANSAIA